MHAATTVECSRIIYTHASSVISVYALKVHPVSHGQWRHESSVARKAMQRAMQNDVMEHDTNTYSWLGRPLEIPAPGRRRSAPSMCDVIRIAHVRMNKASLLPTREDTDVVHHGSSKLTKCARWENKVWFFCFCFLTDLMQIFVCCRRRFEPPSGKVRQLLHMHSCVKLV